MSVAAETAQRQRARASWIPIVGPFVGGLIGAFVYDLGIRDTLVARGEQAPADVEPRGRTVDEYD